MKINFVSSSLLCFSLLSLLFSISINAHPSIEDADTPLPKMKDIYIEYPPLQSTSSVFGVETYVHPSYLRYPLNTSNIRDMHITSTPSFSTLGDWGVKNKKQIEVAKQLETSINCTKSHFILSLGDNFYNFGVEHVDSHEWNTYFEDIYSSPILKHLPFYSILGNHDYRGNPWAQVARTYAPQNERWMLPNYWYYEVTHFNDTPTQFKTNPFSIINNISDYQDTSVEGDTANVTAVFVFIDTIVLAMNEIQDYFVPYNMDVPELFQQQMDFIEETLKQALKTADWIFVVGHYHILYDNPSYEIPSLKKYLLPLFSKYKVDAYFYGHRHSLALYELNGTTHFNSGAGGKSLVDADCTRKECLFGASTHGLTSHVLSKTQMHSGFIDMEGNVIFSYTQNATDKSNFRPKNASEDVSLPPIKRLYIGPNPADTSPQLLILTFTMYGLFGGVIGLFLLTLIGALIYRIVSKKSQPYNALRGEMVEVTTS